MSDTSKDLAACSAYLRQAAQIAPQSVATAVSIVMLACARECARAGRETPAAHVWSSLLQRLHESARHECHIAPSTAPMVDRLLHYFEAFGAHHLGESREHGSTP